MSVTHHHDRHDGGQDVSTTLAPHPTPNWKKHDDDLAELRARLEAQVRVTYHARLEPVRLLDVTSSAERRTLFLEALRAHARCGRFPGAQAHELLAVAARFLPNGVLIAQTDSDPDEWNGVVDLPRDVLRAAQRALLSLVRRGVALEMTNLQQGRDARVWTLLVPVDDSSPEDDA